jgi:twitching motility protein PilT
MPDVNYEVVDPWLRMLWERGGTDLCLTAGSPPRLRLDGRLLPVEGAGVLHGEAIAKIVHALLSEELLADLATHKDVDFAFTWHDLARLRGNAFTQRGQLALALRMIPSRIPSPEELGLPTILMQLAYLPRGLVLVTGPTGSGKSTTLASVIDYINNAREVHVLTLEDPIEYVHDHKRSVINQREIGVDSDSFARGLRSALREDPDVLLIGEMRDLESIQIALTMAETGHLVFATLHTNDASTALDRIIDVFPSDRQDQIRVQLAAAIAAVVAQRLVRRADQGQVAAFEVLMANSAVRNLIREGKTNQLRNIMTTGQKEGMMTLEMSLARLVQTNFVTYDAALSVSLFPKDLARVLGPLSPVAASSPQMAPPLAAQR